LAIGYADSEMQKSKGKKKYGAKDILKNDME